MTSASFDTVILITQPTYQERRSEEILETVMSLALFDRSHCVVFWDHGLSWLIQDQAPETGKSLSKQLSALSLYGSDALFYCRQHRGAILGDQPVVDTVAPLDLPDIVRLLRSTHHAEVF